MPRWLQRRRTRKVYEIADRLEAQPASLGHDITPINDVTLPKLWAVSAAYTVTTPWGDSTRDLPTFYLNPAVQGILDETGARNIVREILHGYEAHGSVSFTVVPLY